MVAGEASGDLHGATLARALRREAAGATCWGIGGDRMAREGVELVYHLRHLAVVGITEVLGHLWDVRRALSTVTAAAVRSRPDAVVLIDYPDFNLALARRLRRRLPEVPIVYYISPQVWAWRSRRVAKITQLVDLMLVILPFEEKLYRDAGVPVEFVGHPLLDVVEFRWDREEFASRHGVPGSATWVGLLPGSRRVEVERLLPPMLQAAALVRGSDLAFLVPEAPSVEDGVYRSCLAGISPEVRKRVYLVADDYYDAVRHSAAVAVCSGTATLEAALADAPMVVVYRTSWLTYNLAKLLVWVRDIALVNLIAGRRGVPELLQREVTGPRIAQELGTLLHDRERRRAAKQVLAEVRRRLGEPGASQRAARAVVCLARGSPGPDDPAPARGRLPAA